MPVWVYERTNKEVRFSCPYFSGQSAVALKISWRDGVKKGATVNPGDPLADLQWDDGESEVLQAPAGCTGVIEATNRQIEYELLSRRPSEWALRLEL